MFASKTSVPSILWHSPPNSLSLSWASGLFLQPASVKALLCHQQGLVRSTRCRSLVSSEFLETLKPCTEVHLHLIFSLWSFCFLTGSHSFCIPCRCLAVVTCQLLSSNPKRVQAARQKLCSKALPPTAESPAHGVIFAFCHFFFFFCCTAQHVEF